MNLLPLFQWFDSTWIGTSIRSSTYAFPVIECFHLLGMVCLLGTILVVDLRLLGFGMRRQPVARVAAALAPITWIGLGTMLVTGLLLFSAEALKCFGNAAFPYKMSFLLLGLIVYFTIHRRLTGLEDARIGRVRGKLVACLSLTLWFGVALAGRAIAFV